MQPDESPQAESTPPSFAERAYREEPAFDEDEGLSDEDKELADTFPASDPPAQP